GLYVTHPSTIATLIARDMPPPSATMQASAHQVDEDHAELAAQNRLVFVNDAGRRLLGFSDGMSLDDRAREAPLLDAGERPLPREAYPSARGLRGEMVNDVPLIVDHPDGIRRHVRISAHPLRRPD